MGYQWWTDLRQALRELLGVIPTLDLHGYGVQEAVEATERFLHDAHAHGETVVRIVYGKGHGSPGGKAVLREVIPRWLDRAGGTWVKRYERLPDTTGADGSVRVWLRRGGGPDRAPASKPGGP